MSREKQTNDLDLAIDLTRAFLGMVSGVSLGTATVMQGVWVGVLFYIVALYSVIWLGVLLYELRRERK